MKETFTYREIQDAANCINELGLISVNHKTAYRLSRIMDRIRSAGKEVGKAQLEIYKTHGYKKEGQREWSVKPEKMDGFIKAMDELMDNSTIEIEYTPVACNMFPQLPAAAILGMGRFMVEEETIISPR